MKSIRLRIKHEREMRELAERYIAENLRLQAREYERRLDHLNDVMGQAAADRTAFMGAARFDEYLKADALWKASVDHRLDVQAGATGRTYLLFGAAVALIPILVALVSHFWGR